MRKPTCFVQYRRSAQKGFCVSKASRNWSRDRPGWLRPVFQTNRSPKW